MTTCCCSGKLCPCSPSKGCKGLLASSRVFKACIAQAPRRAQARAGATSRLRRRPGCTCQSRAQSVAPGAPTARCGDAAKRGRAAGRADPRAESVAVRNTSAHPPWRPGRFLSAAWLLRWSRPGGRCAGAHRESAAQGRRRRPAAERTSEAYAPKAPRAAHPAVEAVSALAPSPGPGLWPPPLGMCLTAAQPVWKAP